MSQHGIDGVNQVQPRIDKSAVEIKDQELDAVGVELAMKLNHVEL
jgi:hypothetical protein